MRAWLPPRVDDGIQPCEASLRGHRALSSGNIPVHDKRRFSRIPVNKWLVGWEVG